MILKTLLKMVLLRASEGKKELLGRNLNPILLHNFHILFAGLLQVTSPGHAMYIDITQYTVYNAIIVDVSIR